MTEYQKSSLNDVISKLNEYEATGQYVPEANKLQSQINQILPSILKSAKKGQLQIGEGLAENIHRSNRFLNDKIIQLNAKYPAKTGKSIPKLPVIAGDANLKTLEQNKQQHVNILESMLDKEQLGWFNIGAYNEDPTGILKTLKGNKDADMTVKNALMLNLIGEYLNTDGSPDRSSDVGDMFDDNTDRMQTFYQILQSYRYLLEATPLAPLDGLKSQIGDDL